MDLYANYANTLAQIAQGSTDELQQAQKDYRVRIEKAHNELEPEGWSYSQEKIFDKFGARGVIGKSGWDSLLKALSENQANAPGAVSEIRAQGEEIKKLFTNADNVLSSLGSLAEEAKPVEGKAIVQVIFDDDVAVENFIDLSKQSEQWKDIIRAYSLLAKQAPENTKIVEFTKSSPLVAHLATTKVIAKAIDATITKFLELRESMLDLKLKALALEKEGLSIAGKRVELIAEIDAIERRRIVETVKQIAEISRVDGLDESLKYEAITALTKAGPKLYAFVTSGGKVDTSDTTTEAGTYSSFKLESKYRSVKTLQNKVQKLIEAGEPKKEIKKERKSPKLKPSKKKDSVKPEVPTSSPEKK